MFFESLYLPFHLHFAFFSGFPLQTSVQSTLLLSFIFSLFSHFFCLGWNQLLALRPEQQQLQQCLRSAVWERVVASCRRDWRWLGLLRPHCSSWQGRSWELFNSRRIGGSASHCLPSPHTYTQMRMHICTYAYLATPQPGQLCVSAPDKASLLPVSTL